MQILTTKTGKKITFYEIKRIKMTPVGIGYQTDADAESLVIYNKDVGFYAFDGGLCYIPVVAAFRADLLGFAVCEGGDTHEKYYVNSKLIER